MQVFHVSLHKRVLLNARAVAGVVGGVAGVEGFRLRDQCVVQGLLHVVEEFVIEEFVEKGLSDDFVLVAAVAATINMYKSIQSYTYLRCDVLRKTSS